MNFTVYGRYLTNSGGQLRNTVIKVNDRYENRRLFHQIKSHFMTSLNSFGRNKCVSDMLSVCTKCSLRVNIQSSYMEGPWGAIIK